MTTLVRPATDERVVPPARVRKVPAPLRKKRRKHRLFVAALMAPWAIGFSVFFLYPLAATVWFSFTRYNLLEQPVFIGLRNYRFFFTQDPYSLQSVRNTLWLTAFVVPARIIFALIIAQLVIQIKRGGSLLRTVFYLPALAPPVAATLAFAYLFNPATGPVNQLLGKLGIGWQPLWFNDPALAKPTLLILSVWGLGDVMVILLATLLQVPNEQYEAAHLDGANAWQRFRYVTLPNIWPVLLFAAVTGVIAMLQFFTQAAVASAVAGGTAPVGGGLGERLGYPDNSMLTFPIWLYVKGFANFQLGYACAMAVMLFVVSLAFTVVLLRRSRVFLYGAEGA